MKEAKLVARFVRGSKGVGGGGGGIAAQLVTATQFPPFNFFTLSLSEYFSLFRQLSTTVL